MGELLGNKYNKNTLHGILKELLKIFNNNPNNNNNNKSLHLAADACNFSAAYLEAGKPQGITG